MLQEQGPVWQAQFVHDPQAKVKNSKREKQALMQQPFPLSTSKHTTHPPTQSNPIQDLTPQPNTVIVKYDIFFWASHRSKLNTNVAFRTVFEYPLTLMKGFEETGHLLVHNKNV